MLIAFVRKNIYLSLSCTMNLKCGGGNKSHSTVNLHEKHPCNEYVALIIILICCFHRYSAEFVRPVYLYRANIDGSSLVNRKSPADYLDRLNPVSHRFSAKDDRRIKMPATVPRYHPLDTGFNRYQYPNAYDNRPERKSKTQTACLFAQVQLGCTFNSLCYFTPGHHRCIINVSPDCCRSNEPRHERSPPLDTRQRYRSPTYLKNPPPLIRPAISNVIAGHHRPPRPPSNFNHPVNHWNDYRWGKLVFYTPFKPRYVTRGRTFLPTKTHPNNLMKNKPPSVSLWPPVTISSTLKKPMNNDSATTTILDGNSIAVCSSQPTLNFDATDQGDYQYPFPLRHLL